MIPTTEGTPPGGFAIPDDESFVATLPASPERDLIAASLLRYRAPELLAPGDAMPTAPLHRATDALDPLTVDALVRDRPLLLVFGSYT